MLELQMVELKKRVQELTEKYEGQKKQLKEAQERN